MSQGIVIKTERLSLPQLNLVHATDTYLSWLNDDELRKGLISGKGKRYTLDDLKDFIEARNQDDYMFAIEFEGRHVGNVRLYDIDKDNRRAEIGFLVGDKSIQGKGVGTEAVSAVTKYALTELELHQVTAGTFSDNIASIRLLEKSGFRKEAHFRDYVFWNGEFRDVFRFGRLATDYLN